MSVEFEVKYERGHTYHETWAPANCFCPACASRETWERQGDGDYYMGTEILCLTCEAEFYLPVGADKRDNWQNRQRLDSLRNPKPPPESSEPA